MENFTPVSAVAGGLLIGSAATLVLWANGRIAGISGIVSGLLLPSRGDVNWRLLFCAGLLSGSLLYVLLSGRPLTIEFQASGLTTALAGLLVGFGTRLGSGCTSGHGVCGIARLSRRSVTATLVFMTSAMLTVYLTRHAGLAP